MPRKLKQESQKVIQRTVTLPRAYEEYLNSKGRISEYIQDLIAKDITGFSFGQFCKSFYSSYDAVIRRHHSQDSLSQEHKRAAKWILESSIDWVEYVPANNCVFMQVKWLASNVCTKIKVDLNIEGFKHVVYDEVRELHPTDIQKGTYFDLEDYIDWYLDPDYLGNKHSEYESDPDTLNINYISLALNCDPDMADELNSELLKCVSTFSNLTSQVRSKIKFITNWVRNQQMGCGAEVV